MGRRLIRRGPGLTERGDPLVHQPAAPMEVDAGPLVLGRVAADAQPQHEAAAGELLERRRLLGHGRGLAQRELEHAGPQ